MNRTLASWMLAALMFLAAPALAAPPAAGKPAPGNEAQLLQTVIGGKAGAAEAALKLAQRGDEAVGPLRQGLQRKGGRTAALCAWAVWRHPNPKLAPDLRVLATSIDQVAAYWAVKALGKMRDRGGVAVLTAMLPKDPNGYWEHVRGNRILLAAGRGKKPAQYATGWMPNLRVACVAMESLGLIGGPQAKACLLRAMDSPQYLMRYGAARGLGAMKPPDALQRLHRLATDDRVRIVRDAAREATAKIDGTWGPPVSPRPPMPEALVFVKTANRTESNLGFRDSYPFPKVPWYHGGENLYVLSPVAPNGTVRNLTKLTGGAVQGPELSYDAKRIVFAMRKNVKTDGFHIYEIGIDGSGLRQLTRGNCNDVDPCYLPDGRIVFCSDRAGYREYYHQERSRVIYVMDADGANVRQITFNPNQDYAPLVLRDGQVLYASYRFYAQDGSGGPLLHERFHQRIETVLRTVRPDGSNDQLFYGAMRGSFYTPVRPMPYSLQYSGWHPRGSHIGVVTSQAREMPDGGFICITPAGLTHVETALAPIDCERPVYPEVLNLAGGEEVYIHNFDHLNPAGRYTSPHPAGGKWVFVSHAEWHKQGGAAYGIYLFDLATRTKVLVYDDPTFSDIDPIPVVPRPLPKTLAPQAPPEAGPTGRIYCASVFRSDLPYNRRAVKSVRVIAALYQPLSINANASFRTRVLGTVPLEKDGSFYVEVPADTPLRFQLLDADGRALVHETAFTYVRPGETKGCVGCHETKNTLPLRTRPLATHHAPARAILKRGDLLYQGQPSQTYNLIVRE